ncbi:MAG: hypothetical protein J6T12_10145 [Salinivirgaceae bacterium]|nr:hypothetical protein [Salinivirgaceae bacterium]
MKAIKGFDENLKGRDFQYEIGKTYTIDEDKVEICECGFHAIPEDSDPMNVFNFYPPAGVNGTKSRYCEVELNGVIKENNEKAASSSITIVREIGINGVIAAHEAYVKANLIDDNNEHNTGDQSSASNTGDRSSASNTGDQSSASNTGDQSSASNTGDGSSASNTGNRSSASNTGDQSSAEVSGKDSVAIATGYQCKAKGALGCAIVVAERGEWNGKTYPLLAICAAIVDGEKIKADTWYTAENGELVEKE